MRELRAAFVVALCVLGFFALVGGAYVAINPEIVGAFIGSTAKK